MDVPVPHVVQRMVVALQGVQQQVPTARQNAAQDALDWLDEDRLTNMLKAGDKANTVLNAPRTAGT